MTKRYTNSPYTKSGTVSQSFLRMLGARLTRARIRFSRSEGYGRAHSYYIRNLT